MLPHEINPFANHHIDTLKQLADVLEHRIQNDTLTLTKDEALVMSGQLNDAAHALVRFKVCMADEVEQKDRYRTYAQANGYPFS